MVKFVSWNVNGIRACVKKGFLDYFHKVNADIFCIQETKVQEGQITLDLAGYYQYWHYAEKKGYSGTAIFTKVKPLSVNYGGVGNEQQKSEGRVITLEFEEFYLVNVYTPNSQRDLARLDYRLQWEKQFRNYIIELEKQKPVIICGDMNVAHNDIDVKNYKSNRKNSGFTIEERTEFGHLLNSGFIDSFRFLFPDREGAYTWWSYMRNVRERNIGWRIDYFLVSVKLKSSITGSEIHSDILGSDHCPVLLTLG
ncbi:MULTISPECIES: exodeoxyribonuclease III [Bacillaceae]|uniref:Exodeoxyribonuclease III n=1 Tax=Evansella alkalicola TaxID=745819 RepID=A0ABS6JRV6_9BACI|nr:MULTISPECIES: exodeoxyribonuclease III [Bacillaceae]MBU9721218.1 exodeoxyribonuclease III [Bacillus alkalicola]